MNEFQNSLDKLKIDVVKIVLQQQIKHAKKQIVRWERFLVLERNNSRPLKYRHGTTRLKKTIEKWKNIEEVLELASEKL